MEEDWCLFTACLPSKLGKKNFVILLPVFFRNDCGRSMLEKVQSISIQGQGILDWENGYKIHISVDTLTNDLNNTKKNIEGHLITL